MTYTNDRKFKSEVSKLKKKFAANKWPKNEFNSPALAFSDYPELDQLFQSNLPVGYTHQHKDTVWYAGIRPQHFELQWHQMSVEEHVDDAAPGQLFQIAILSTIPRVDSAYNRTPTFNFYSFSRRKHTERLEVGKVITFNPRKPHALIYYGDDVLLAICSIAKIKKPKSVLQLPQQQPTTL